MMRMKILTLAILVTLGFDVAAQESEARAVQDEAEETSQLEVTVKQPDRQPTDKGGSIDDLFVQIETVEPAGAMTWALEFNPDLEAARAQLRAAEARVRQLELKAASDVVRLQGEIMELERRLQGQRRLVDKEFAEADSLVGIEAELEAKRGELAYMLGRPAKVELLKRLNADLDETSRSVAEKATALSRLYATQFVLSSKVRPTIDDGAPERIRAKLDSPVATIEFVGTAPRTLAEIVDSIAAQYEVNINLDITARDLPITINLTDVSLRHALTAITDAADLVALFRDYGVFITNPERARRIGGPTIPEGIPYTGPAGTPAQVHKRMIGNIPMLKQMGFDMVDPDPEKRPLQEEDKLLYDKVHSERLNRENLEFPTQPLSPSPAPMPDSPRDR
jgi:hypothetical protein